LEGKSLWIVDDMIDTAGSIETFIHALSTHKPKEINVISIHALFSPPAAERLASLVKNGFLNRLIVTDTICCSASILERLPRLEIVHSAELAAKIIKTIVSNESMSKLLRPFNAETSLSGNGE
jgi:ribose-phosphate pyrophosphokinase